MILLSIVPSQYHCVTDRWTDRQTDRWTDGHTYHLSVAQWLSGRASDLRSKGRGFEPRPWRCCATTLAKLFTPHCLIYAILHEEDCELLIKSNQRLLCCSIAECDKKIRTNLGRSTRHFQQLISAANYLMTSRFDVITRLVSCTEYNYNIFRVLEFGTAVLRITQIYTNVIKLTVWQIQHL